MFQMGHSCGDFNDIIDGYPTGSVRISFGYMSTYEDAEHFLKMIQECFVKGKLIIDTSWLSSPKYENSIKESINIDIESDAQANIKTARSLKSQEKTNLHLTDIFLYPVKSCAAIRVHKWKIGSEGLEFDRNWMVINKSWITITQKRLPKMNLIRPSLDLVKRTLSLHFLG